MLLWQHLTLSNDSEGKVPVFVCCLVLLSGLAWEGILSDIGRIDLSDLSHLVIDEADTLLDDSFAEAVDAVMKCIQVRKV